MLKLRLVFVACAALAAAATHAAPFELKLLGVDGKGVGATVVVLRSTDPARPLARATQATMDQINRQFDPNVLVVPTGSKVSFPNKDTVQHQVYSFSQANTFDLPLYRGTRSVDFGTAGIVAVGCNIHDKMRAFIFVVDAQYFGRTDATGSLNLPDVQPGSYTVQIWHPRARNMKPLIDQTINFTAAEPRVTLRLATALRLRPLSELPGNWDAY